MWYSSFLNMSVADSTYLAPHEDILLYTDSGEGAGWHEM